MSNNMPDSSGWLMLRWATKRSTNSDAQDIYDAIYKRLDRLTDAGVTIVAAAGPEEMLGGRQGLHNTLVRRLCDSCDSWLW